MLPQTKVGYKHMSMTLLKKKKKKASVSHCPVLQSLGLLGSNSKCFTRVKCEVEN